MPCFSFRFLFTRTTPRKIRRKLAPCQRLIVSPIKAEDSNKEDRNEVAENGCPAGPDLHDPLNVEKISDNGRQ